MLKPLHLSLERRSLATELRAAKNWDISAGMP